MLIERGWAVRGTSRRADGLEAIASAGVEAALADPDRVGTIVELLGDVTVVCWLLGSVEGGSEVARTLHVERLPSLLEKLVDTPVRGYVHEAAGSADGGALEAGGAAVVDAAERWRIPVEWVRTSRETGEAWAERVANACSAVIGGGPTG
jgi:uncharacterized protein YbjT (DUF2867 family)